MLNNDIDNGRNVVTPQNKSRYRTAVKSIVHRERGFVTENFTGSLSIDASSEFLLPLTYLLCARSFKRLHVI
jgi:hypothetical protein